MFIHYSLRAFTYRSSRKMPTQEYVVPKSIPTAGAIVSDLCDVVEGGREENCSLSAQLEKRET